MPYKDPEHKREWEHRNRDQRLKRRNELRSIKAMQDASTAATPDRDPKSPALIGIPIVVGGLFALHDPVLGMAVGSLTLVVAALGKKGPSWWILGIVILVLAILAAVRMGKETVDLQAIGDPGR
jgi:hypothetical protein